MSAQGLPPNLLGLFVPRQPLKFLPPCDSFQKRPAYTGIATLIDNFETDSPPPKEPFETPAEKKTRKKQEALDEHKKRQEALALDYDPNTQPSATKNPFATLFVGRLSYESTEKKLKKEFERYGPIRKVKIITDTDGKSRGYAFIEYESESDLKKAYKLADGTKIDGKRVLVDVERARTVPNWLPRRLGGGKGPARFAEPKKKGRATTAASASASAAAPSVSSFPPPSSGSDFRSKPSGAPRDNYGAPQRSSFGGASYGGGRDSSRRDRDDRGGGGSRYSGGGAPQSGGAPTSRYTNRSRSPVRDRRSSYAGGSSRRDDDRRH